MAVEYEALRQSFSAQNAILTEVKRFAVGTSHSTLVVEDSTRRFFGKIHMYDLPPSPKVFVVCSAVDATPPQPYLFRSYELNPDAFAASEFIGTANVYTHEAARATTSAPTFYAPAVIGGQRSEYDPGAAAPRRKFTAPGISRMHLTRQYILPRCVYQSTLVPPLMQCLTAPSSPTTLS